MWPEETHAGQVSRELADARAETEFRRHKERHKNDLSRVEQDFIRTVDANERKLLK